MIRKYVKNPIVIQALRYNGDMSEVFKFVPEHFILIFSEALFLKTSEGKLHVRVGDYIVKGVSGEFYPVKANIFALSYSQVDTED